MEYIITTVELSIFAKAATHARETKTFFFFFFFNGATDSC